MNKHYLIVDVGGTKILAAVLNADGDISARCKLKTDRSDKETLLRQIDEAMQGALDDAGLARKDIAGVALGVPGVVDTKTGYIVFTPNTPLTADAVGRAVARQMGLPGDRG